MKLDKNTFGDSPAAINIVDILEKLDDKKALRKVGKIHGRMCKGFDLIARLPITCREDRDIRETLVQLWLHEKVQKTLQTKILTPNVASHLVNMIVGKYRESQKLADRLDKSRNKIIDGLVAQDGQSSG